MLAGLVMLVMAVLGGAPLRAGETIILQSTTSTQNSGLLDWLLPKFTEKTGIRVKVVAVGTGQALKNAARGDGDVVLVHARAAEEEFIRKGYGVDRRDVMYNDFVIVCPKSLAGMFRAGGRSDADGAVARPSEPAKEECARKAAMLPGRAGIGGGDAAEALRRIAEARVPFVSRGDDSGTHKKELALWRVAGIDPRKGSGTWYREAGRGMGATLNMAAAMNACTLTDRATWIAHNNRGDLTIVVQGDPKLFNQYGVMLVNPKRHAHVKEKAARVFIDWLTGPEGQRLIGQYRLKGQQLFFPNAK